MERTAGITEVNGTRLYYETAGEGIPIVLIHGLGLDTRMWDGQFETFAETHRVIRYDLRGFGKSDLPTGASFRHADDLRALLDHLEAPTAHVIGLSMGGRIALQHGLLFPAATLSLILVDSALDGFHWSDEWETSIDAIAEHAQHAGAAAGNAMWLEHELFAPACEQPECRATLARIVTESSGWQWVNESHEQRIEPAAIDRLAEVDVPTLVVVGDRDLPDFQRIADTLAHGIPAARKVVLHGVGHMSTMENAGEFNSLARGFLQMVESGRDNESRDR